VLVPFVSKPNSKKIKSEIKLSPFLWTSKNLIWFLIMAALFRHHHHHIFDVDSIVTDNKLQYDVIFTRGKLKNPQQ